MKKLLIISCIIFVIILGLFLFKSKSSVKSPVAVQKFYTNKDILPNDTLIRITDDGFVPSNVTIKNGSRIAWINESKSYSWPASDPHPTHGGYSGFDPEEPFSTGEIWTFTFSKSGSWSFHDHLNPGRRGVVKVID